MTTQRTFEPHEFAPYAEANNICRHCDRGRYALHHEQPRREQGSGETTGECGFDEAWIGKCKQIGNPRCAKHTGRVCVSCGADAVRNCEETGQFVCGADLCGDCEHTIFPSGTNGGIGFNAQSLPKGMKRHCRKTEQKFKPWYARDDNEDDDAPAAPERGETTRLKLPARPIRESTITEQVIDGSLIVRQHGDRYLLINESDWPIAEMYNEQEAEELANQHNQHSTLIEQRERLLRLLRPVTSPTACYCAVMGGEKCWHCEARELITTI